jgi:O-acetyl-ADP-ribose deacetylase (regulator of RNase III)
LVSVAGEGSRIEFNPHRRPARVRFSVANELGHLLFPDHQDLVRYRNASHSEHRRADDWQLEILCNVAAAELLMPVGAFPREETENLSLPHLLDLRATFGVSAEALLRRVVKLTDLPVALFASARLPEGGYRIDYVVDSRAWEPEVRGGQRVGPETILAHCTAVGFSTDGVERWPNEHEDLRVQAVGVPPFPGDRYPRIVGLLQPSHASVLRVPGLRLVRGDATQPHVDGPAVIAHVVNDAAPRWGGRGFAPALGKVFPDVFDEYARWAQERGNRRLGAIHVAEARENLWVASLVAQSGYGDAPTARPRLRLNALRRCLEQLAAAAAERSASVHMPPIGTGQGGMRWPPIRDLLLEELADRGVPVTVYFLPNDQMPEEVPASEQLTLA